ncbi:MAG TPA: CDP-alcohol phosphatidyltransferase family protein [Patescibacteria group bacterium]|nr:CDP-alcohol phosphatidyltransferase family protein [Patescibacteria group bacterium]
MLFLDAVRKYIRSYIARLARSLDRLSKGRISPDIITWIGVIAHLPIAFLIGYGELELAAILMIFFGLFDVLDGELARLKKIASPRGMMLDASTDRVKEVMIYSGIVYYISQTEYSSWSFLAVVACGGILTVSYIKAKGEVAYAVKNKSDDHHKINRMFSEALVPFEVRTFIIILALFFNQLLFASALIAILATISIFERIQFIGKKI